MFENILKLSWKYVNKAEIISKVTLTLSLMNSNNDFHFVGWVIQTPCHVYFIFAVYNFTLLVTFWLWWKLLQHLSTKDNERNLCQDLLTIENTDSDLKVHALHYAIDHELLVRVRFSFQKHLQTPQTNRNNKKLSITGFGYDLRNSRINSTPE